MEYAWKYETPIGKLTLAEEDGRLTRLSFGENIQGCTLSETPFLQEAFSQLSDYFAGKRKEFDLPLAAKGTAFQQKVWNALCTIPYGETRSYEDIAVLVGSPKACRAVGLANNKNPIAIVVPCHRVIGKNGALTGYAGGLSTKTFLLALETGQPKS